MVIVGEVLHNVLHTALEDVAELVDGIDLHILVVAKPVDLGTVYIVVGVQIVLGDVPFFHGLPQPVIFYHGTHNLSLAFFPLLQ